MYQLSNTYIYLRSDPDEFLSKSEFKIFQSGEFTVAGEQISIDIVGESHLITASNIGYQEAVIHKEFASATAMLNTDSASTLNFTVKTKEKGNVIGVSISLEPYDEARVKLFDNAQLRHVFKGGGLTAIMVLPEEDIIKTLHTYPEYDKMLLTETRF